LYIHLNVQGTGFVATDMFINLRCFLLGCFSFD